MIIGQLVEIFLSVISVQIQFYKNLLIIYSKLIIGSFRLEQRTNRFISIFSFSRIHFCACIAFVVMNEA